MFSNQERSAVLSLSAIMIFRMVGLFIIIPIFSPYLHNLSNSTPMLIGITMGVYGLSQAALQIPFGILSDYIGRREVITLGLGLFFIGSIVAGISENIWIIMLGRALQGAGAISGTLMALLSDLTSEESRTKAMAVIGMSVGAAFMLAFMLGPILNSVISVNKIFYLVAFLVLPILYILWQVTPVDSQHNILNIKNSKNLYSNNFKHLNNLIKNKSVFNLIKLHSFGIFSLHGVLMANFIAVPMLLKNLELSNLDQGLIYIKVFLIAILFMVPLIIYSEKYKQQNRIIKLSVFILILAELILYLYHGTFWGIMFGLVMFFIGFNILEASLPSLISKIAPKQNKGAALGMYSTAQFLGPMLGGLIAGVLYKYFGLASIFILGILWSGLWLSLVIICFMKPVHKN